MNNTGSFGAAIGGMTPELQAAVQRRAGSPPAPAQVSNSAPTANPSTQIPNQVQSPSGGSMAGQIPNLGGGSSESKIIIQALKGRLEALSKGGILQ